MVGKILKLKIDPIFWDKMNSGRKTVTFVFNPGKADYHDVFFVNKNIYQIDKIQDMDLYQFVSHHWHSAGFDNPKDAVEWIIEHRFDGEVGEQYGPKFQSVKGRMYTFKKVSEDWPRIELNIKMNDFWRSVWGMQYYLNILKMFSPEEMGYDETYLEKCEQYMKEIDDNELLFDFSDKLFFKDEEED